MTVSAINGYLDHAWKQWIVNAAINTPIATALAFVWQYLKPSSTSGAYYRTG